MRAGGARSHLSAVFLDRDGVINRKRPEGSYVTRWEELELLEGALDALALLASAGVAVIVVTNQRGIARGRMTELDLAHIHDHLRAVVSDAGGRLDAIYHCPHEGPCRCRKPETGMFEDAAGDFGLRLTETAVIGDQPSDMEAARRIGALGVRVGVPPQAGDVAGAGGADHVARDLMGAVRWLGERGHLVLDAGIVKSARGDADAPDQALRPDPAGPDRPRR